MIKYLKNYLPVIVFVAAAFSAFAFKAQDPDPNLEFFEKQTTGDWKVVNSEFDCDLSSIICVAQFEGDDPEFGEMVYQRDGTFVASP